MSTTLEPITTAESEELANCEQVVIGYKRELIEVAKALRTIRDKRLYRQDFLSFAAYCKDRFGFSKSRGYQLIEFAVQAESTTVDTEPPANERQARARKAKEKPAGAPDPAGEFVGGAATREDAAPAEFRPPDSAEVLTPPAPPTKDADFAAALGRNISSVVNFFASQFEEMAQSVIDDASDEQLDAAILAAETAVRKLKRVRLERRERQAA